LRTYWLRYKEIKFGEHDRILVFPCGGDDGGVALCRELAAQVPLGLVVGIDPSDDAIRAARFAARDIDNVMFVWMDGPEIPWRDGFFTHAILKDTAPVLDEIHRVLAEGGQLITQLD
jgi:SAM-dependent methyltransferase